MAVIGTLNKQPSEVLRADFDYASEFLGTGEQLLSATVTSSPAGLSASQTNDLPGSVVNLLVSGGTDGEIYTVTVVAEISDGQVIESELIVSVEEISA